MNLKRGCLILSFLLLAVGCQKEKSAPTGTEASAGGIKLAFISNNPFEFWTFAERGTEKAAAELGVQVEFRRPARGTAAEQKQIIEDLLVKGVKGIAISPNDAVSSAPFLDEVAEKTLLVTVDSDVPPGHKRLCYLGTNNFEAGRSAGELVKEALPEGGEIAIFVGGLDKLNAAERRAGVLAALAGVTTYQEADVMGRGQNLRVGRWVIVDTRTDGGSEPRCKANAEDILVTHPNVKCLVGLYEYNPPALLNVVTDKQKLGQIAIVGFDENEATLNGIKEGHIFGTVVQQPFEFGYQSMKLLHALAQGDRTGLPENGILHIPHKTITRKNVAGFIEELKEQRGK